ncbi:MAG: YjbH domain-containing protein, partial [Parachlamydiales bacterium]|nr:YjbH domain-containing protein [Parachlamydiales bacterium]
MKLKLLFTSLIFLSAGFGLIDPNSYKCINSENYKELPANYNFNGIVGYFNMPSARSVLSGKICFGYSFVDPYNLFSSSLQYFDNFELSFNYWIYNNYIERGFGHLGFGNDADRALNVKLLLKSKNFGFQNFFDVAIGFNDLFGSKRFHSKYIVLTKQFFNENFEVSFGYSKGRINGFFGGVEYYPFIDRDTYLSSLSFAVEYDANDYQNHLFEHPKGKKVNTPINIGLHYNFWDFLQLSLSSIRGQKIAGSISAYCDLNSPVGMYPKYLDPPLYNKKKSNNLFKEEESLSHKLNEAFKNQGIDLCKAALHFSEGDKKSLSLSIENNKYTSQKNLKERIQGVLISSTFDDIENINVGVENYSVPINRYSFQKKYLEKYKNKEINSFEIEALTPLKNYSKDYSTLDSNVIYQKNSKIFYATFKPIVNAYFGSTKGKFKYDSGLSLLFDGYLPNQKIYYNLQSSFFVKSSNKDVGDKDKYNPSQIINVRSDFINYYKSKNFHLEKLYFQKDWNLQNGYFLKAALGYFEMSYAGIAFESLYYPVSSKNFAVGFQVANIYKRSFENIFSFQKKVRKLENTNPTYENFIGFQYFLDLYYDYKPYMLRFKTSVGQFLAKDFGVKFEIFKFFKSGVKISSWITF